MQGSFLWGWNILQGQDNDYSPQDKLGEAIVASAFGDTDALSTATMIDGQTELVVRIAGKGPTGYTPELLVNVDGLNVTEFDVEAVRSAGEFDEFIFIVNDADVEHVSLYFDNPVSQSALYVDYIEVNNVRYEGEAAENHAVPEGYATSTFATMFTNGALVFEI